MLMFFPFDQHLFVQRSASLNENKKTYYQDRKKEQGAVAGNIATAPCRFKKPSFIKAQFLLQCSFQGTGVHHQTPRK